MLEDVSVRCKEIASIKCAFEDIIGAEEKCDCLFRIIQFCCSWLLLIFICFGLIHP